MHRKLENEAEGIAKIERSGGHGYRTGAGEQGAPMDVEERSREGREIMAEYVQRLVNAKVEGWKIFAGS